MCLTSILLLPTEDSQLSQFDVCRKGQGVSRDTLAELPGDSPGQAGPFRGNAGAVLHWDLQGRLK